MMLPKEKNKFEHDIDLWNEISSSYPDIYVETNTADHYEWHVTITKYNPNNRNEYKFHFMVIWNDICPRVQPKS